jgi:hypothetical protein
MNPKDLFPSCFLLIFNWNFAKITFSFLIFNFSFSLAQTYPTIHSSRPRIYADSARFTWLQVNKALPGDCQTTYNEFNYRYNNWWINDPQLYLLGNDTTAWTWNWTSTYARDEGIFVIFMYRLNPDQLALKRCRFLARKAIDALNTANYPTMAYYDKEDFLRKFSDVGSLLIDWCYDALPDTLLHELVRAQYKMDREFMNTFILSSAGTSYVSSHNAWNCVFTNQNTLVLHNAEGLTIAQKDTVHLWYQAVYDKWINGFFPCYGYYRDDDGGWNWGAAYAMWSLVDQFQLFDNMLIATGQNFYASLPWVQNSINQYWYFIQPNEWCIHLGDGVTFLAGDRVTYRHAKLFNDPRSIWLSQYYSQSQYYYSTPYVFQKLLYKDFTLPAIAKPDPPHDWWADKVGWSVSRTSWESNAALVWFFNSKSKKAAHEHQDNNTFGIFKNAPLIVDAGVYDSYGSSHYMNYYSRTIAHNSVCVFDTTDTYYYGTQPVSNDGGQKFSNAMSNYNDIFAPAFQRGKWIQWTSGTDYCYNIADAALSYDTANKCNRFIRRLLFVKPDKVVILDHLHLKNTTNHQRDARFLLHFDKKPVMAGNLITSTTPGHIENYAGNDFSLTNGNGNVAIRTLFPVNHKLRLIGGTSYEYYVNGQNYPPSTTPDTVHGSPGKWRIEVSPAAVSDSTLFLHTIRIGDNLNVSVAGGIGQKNSISIACDWDNFLFLFSAKGDTGVTEHRMDNIPGNRLVKLFASDMKRNTIFRVLVDSLPAITDTSDGSGLIRRYLTLGAGIHHIRIVLYVVEGNIIYDNGNGTPIANATVYLKQGNVVLDQTLTDASGHYVLKSPTYGNYTLTITCNNPWAGVNAADALIDLQHFVHILTLPGLRAVAGDVNGSWTINSIDALMIAKRFVGTINSFPVGDWVFENMDFWVPGNVSLFITLKGLCAGDVNGSNIP